MLGFTISIVKNRDPWNIRIGEEDSSGSWNLGKGFLKETRLTPDNPHGLMRTRLFSFFWHFVPTSKNILIN
jgi:hypothetical protein